MSEPIQRPIFANFHKVKAEGRQRVSRIQEVLRSAFSQVAIEIKEGSREIRAIAQNPSSTSSQTEAQTTEPTVSVSAEPIQIEIVQDEGVSTEATPTAVAVPVVVTSASTSDSSAQEPSDAWVKAFAILDAIRDQVIADLRQRAATSQRLAQLKTWFATTDQRFTEQYGDRYGLLKEKWEQWSDWYQTTSAKAATIDPDPLHIRKTAAEQRAAAAGTRFAQQERRMKDRIKSWF